MALLDELLYGGAQFPAYVPPRSDEGAAVDDAMEAGAARIKRGVRHPLGMLAGAPYPGMGAMGAMGLLNQNAFPEAGAAPVAGAMNAPPVVNDQPPATNDPTSGEPQVFQNGVPLPKPRPLIPSETAGGAPTDMSAQSQTAGVDIPDKVAPAALTTPAEAPDFPKPRAGMFGSLGGIMGNILRPENAPLFLALGGGFAGAGSIGTGMRRAFSGAVPPAMQLAQLQKQEVSQATLFRALTQRGIPSSEAMAAVLDPDIKKGLIAKYFETKPFVPHKIGVDMYGNDIMGSFDPNTNRYFDAAGRPMASAGGGGAVGGGTGSAPDGVLAKGVTEYNAELPADEYLSQFAPGVRAQIENYASGDTMPTGNPRIKGSGQKIKEWAQLWGTKAGVPVSDAAFSEKRKMRTDLGGSSPATMGGILSNGKSAFEHLANLGDKFVQLGNYSGPSIPGGAAIGATGNWIGNQMAPTPQTVGKLQAVRDNALKYGQESTKFYAGTGGGAAERTHALDEVASPTTNAEAQAAFMQTEKELMLGRLREKEAQIRNTLGDQYLAQHPVMDARTQNMVSRIDANIARLRGGGAAAPEAAPAGKTGTGVQWRIVQ